MMTKKLSTYTILLLVGFASVIFTPTDVHATFHFWDINEIYSNADGTRQFIELFTSVDGQQFVSGHDINATSDGNTNTFNFGGDSPSPTSNHSLLLATSTLASSRDFQLLILQFKVIFLNQLQTLRP